MQIHTIPITAQNFRCQIFGSSTERIGFIVVLHVQLA
jgi:hypothetical protein